MSQTVCETMATLCVVTQSLPIGTNLALLHFLWMLLSGSLLSSRGALFPALSTIGLRPAAVRRAWAALWCGAWAISIPLHIWRQHVEGQQRWHVHQYDGYSAKAVDITAYWRPAWKGCKTKHYHPQAGRALSAVTMGLIGRVGSVNGQRVAVLTDLVRSDPDDPSEAILQADLLKQVTETLADDEMPVFDAGFKIRQLQMVQSPRWVVRLAKNFTARRNRPTPYQGKGRRPEYGEKVTETTRERYETTLIGKELHVMSFPDIQWPEFPDILGGLKDFGLIALLVVAAILLIKRK